MIEMLGGCFFIAHMCQLYNGGSKKYQKYDFI